ncbi:MAG: hypothetical protein LQ348_004882 [Seirophora lacunosa]|nr:MAG: hypothetical protein LQ348_004882 [Seirophora lacunosa]
MSDAERKRSCRRMLLGFEHFPAGFVPSRMPSPQSTSEEHSTPIMLSLHRSHPVHPAQGGPNFLPRGLRFSAQQHQRAKEVKRLCSIRRRGLQKELLSLYPLINVDIDLKISRQGAGGLFVLGGLRRTLRERKNRV